MSTVQAGLMTADEFWEWGNRPENANKRVELVRGEIVEMPSPGEVHGTVCWWIGALLALYVMKRGKGRATTNDTADWSSRRGRTRSAVPTSFFSMSRSHLTL
jgi:Uma2 family endonuclease